MKHQLKELLIQCSKVQECTVESLISLLLKKTPPINIPNISFLNQSQDDESFTNKSSSIIIEWYHMYVIITQYGYIKIHNNTSVFIYSRYDIEEASNIIHASIISFINNGFTSIDVSASIDVSTSIDVDTIQWISTLPKGWNTETVHYDRAFSDIFLVTLVHFINKLSENGCKLPIIKPENGDYVTLNWSDGFCSFFGDGIIILSNRTAMSESDAVSYLCTLYPNEINCW